MFLRKKNLKHVNIINKYYKLKLYRFQEELKIVLLLYLFINFKKN